MAKVLCLPPSSSDILYRMPKDKVSVNLADPKDIRAKMPELKRLLATASQELEALREQVAMLTRIVGDDRGGIAVSVSGGGSVVVEGQKVPARQRRPKIAPAQERAAQALEQAGSPMGPAALFKFMEANDLERPRDVTALNAVLWAAAKAGRVEKRPNNTYAPAEGFPSASNGHAQLPGPHNGSSTAAAQASPQTQYAPGEAGT